MGFLLWRWWCSLLERSIQQQAFYDNFPVWRYDEGLGVALAYGLNLGGMPQLIARFDWRFGHIESNIPDLRRGKDPQSIYAAPDQVQELLAIAERDFDPKFRDRTVVFGHTPELPLSVAFGDNHTAHATTVARLHKFFKYVYFEAKDIDIAGVRGMFPPPYDMYLRRVVSAAFTAIAAASIKDSSKPRKVLAAWGHFMGFIEQGDGDLPFKPAGFNALLREARKSRRQARQWSQTEEAREAGVEVRAVDHQNWWSTLAQYRFVLSPLGTAITSPKTLEALLVLTVPIVQRGPYTLHDELVHLGFPLVVVDRWADITSTSLEHWWRDLSPHMESFRRHCATTDGYWRLLTGQIQYCA